MSVVAWIIHRVWDFQITTCPLPKKKNSKYDIRGTMILSSFESPKVSGEKQWPVLLSYSTVKIRLTRLLFFFKHKSKHFYRKTWTVYRFVIRLCTFFQCLLDHKNTRISVTYKNICLNGLSIYFKSERKGRLGARGWLSPLKVFKYLLIS